MQWRRVAILTGRDDAYAVKRPSELASADTWFPRIGSHSAPRNVPMQRGRGRSTPDELSTREVEVLQAVAEAVRTRGIGDELGLSALTVKSHPASDRPQVGEPATALKWSPWPCVPALFANPNFPQRHFTGASQTLVRRIRLAP